MSATATLLLVRPNIDGLVAMVNASTIYDAIKLALLMWARDGHPDAQATRVERVLRYAEVR